MRKDAKIKTARRLRKAMTKPEIWLRAGLKSHDVSGPVFRRQHPIGPYIHFYCVKVRLAIEVDGETHTRESQRLRDAESDTYLAKMGIMTHWVIARDLLMSPDGIIAGILDLTLQRMTELGVPLPSFAPQMPMACESYTFAGAKPA